MIQIPLLYRLLAMIGLSLACVGFGFMQGISHETAKRDKEELERQTAAVSAINKRLADNQETIRNQREINKTLTEKKDAELTKVRADLNAERLRRGQAICSGSSTQTATSGTSGSNGADTGSGVFREDVERDLKSLILKMEAVAATARTCQDFVVENKLAP